MLTHHAVGNMTQQEIKQETIRIIHEECVIQGVVDEAQIAYVLATVEWETAHTWLPVKEAFWTSEKWRKKHLRYYPYFGRGFCQITWKENYEKFGKLLGVDLVEHPDLALYPKYAAYILVYGMKHGTFTGKKLGDYMSSEGNFNFVDARHIINGSDKAHTMASIAKEFMV